MCKCKKKQTKYQQKLLRSTACNVKKQQHACIVAKQAVDPFEKNLTGSLTARLLNVVGRGETVSPLQGRGQVTH